MTNHGSSSARRTSSAWTALGDRIATAHVGPLRGGGLWGSVLVILVFLAISIPQYGQPYVIDEAVFPYVADGILKNGAPFFYNGESRAIDVGLWHPPLYDYLLAGHFKLWGVSTYAARSFGAICVIAAFFLLALALRRVAPNMRQYGYVVLAALFLLNPLVISDALVPDIDGSFGVTLVALSIWLATILAQKSLSRPLILALFGWAVLAVSTKFIIAAIVLGVVGGAALISQAQRWWKVLWVAVTFVAGAAVSFALQFALGYLLKYNALDPFIYLFGSLGSRAPGRSGLVGAFVNLTVGPGSNVVWIGPAIILCSIASLVILLVMRSQSVSQSLAVLLVAFSIAILIGYSYITASPFNFPKYTAVAVPGFAIVLTLILTRLDAILPDRGARSRRLTVLFAAVYAVVLAGGTAVAFLILARSDATKSRNLSQLALLSVAVFIGVVIATALLAYLLSPTSEPRGSARLRRPVLVGLVAALVLSPIMVQVSSSLVNLTTPYATRYYYGEHGMAQFLAEADAIIPKNATVISPKDVGLQLERPYYEDAQLLLSPVDELKDKLEKIGAPYLVTRKLWDYSEPVFPDHFAVFRELYAPVLDDPDMDFVLWKLRSVD